MSRIGSVSAERIADCFSIAKEALLAERNPAGYWTGELSSSALSTATAVMALTMVRRDHKGRQPAGEESDTSRSSSCDRLSPLIQSGVTWLARHQNDDGGWGDTSKSISNISTSMLARAVFRATGNEDRYRTTVEAANAYIAAAGGVEAVLARYGKDKTFSIPILTHCALAGLSEWRDVIPLPFELACLPARFYKTVRLPVVSYALPALIAIGQVRYQHLKPWNPLLRLLRKLSIGPSLRRLERIQPSNGGFLEATPLTSFVTMSLAGMGLSEHPVALRGVEFLIESVRPGGSWPIDTNLATWVTTLSVNALRDDLPRDNRPAVRQWLLEQQYRGVHPYTSADPGGWAWTDLPGGVPDGDDTPGAILALLCLRSPADDRSHEADTDARSSCTAEAAEKEGRAADPRDDSFPAEAPRSGERGTGELAGQIPESERQALANGVKWLLDLQNRDHGWPTFCRGWGALPFDRSAPDISAHVIRALLGWSGHPAALGAERQLLRRAGRAVETGFDYLAKTQRSDGSWLPLWFGNQFAQEEVNPTYGTARVLAAYRDAGRFNSGASQHGLQWLRASQNADGGFGGDAGIDSSVEETALAVEMLVSAEPETDSSRCGLAWLIDRVESGAFRETTPIGFYFAKLWYFEKLYPLVLTVAALRRAQRSASSSQPGASPQQQKHRQQQTVSD